MNKSNYEFLPIDKLIGLSAKYFTIPESLILNKELNKSRLSIFSYLSIKCGMDNRIRCSIPTIVAWSGQKPNSSPNMMNEKYQIVMNKLKDSGYIKQYFGELKKGNFIEVEWNVDKIKEECSHFSFAVIYVDELNLIMDYKKNVADDKNRHLTNNVLLLVFAYLRNAIYRRSNKLRPEEYTGDLKQDIINRRKIHPEAYDDTYVNIAQTLGISAQTVTKAIKILNELGLITIYTPKRMKMNDDKYLTPPTIFTNSYKREDKYLLGIGEEYTSNEIKIKESIVKNTIVKYYKYRDIVK